MAWKVSCVGNCSMILYTCQPSNRMPKVSTTFKMSELKNPLLLSHRFKWAFKRKETIMSTLKYAIAVEEHCGEHIFLVLSAV